MNGHNDLRPAEAPAMQLGQNGARLPDAHHGDPSLDLNHTHP